MVDEYSYTNQVICALLFLTFVDSLVLPLWHHTPLYILPVNHVRDPQIIRTRIVGCTGEWNGVGGSR